LEVTLPKIEWTTMYGVGAGGEIVEVEAYPVEGGYVVRHGCFRDFVEAGRLSTTRAGAEERLRKLSSENGGTT
jgi:hypothetical protein